jgi:hypothetical protein
VGYFGTRVCTANSNMLLEDGRPVQSLDVLGYIHRTVPALEMISSPGAIRTLAVRSKRGGI